MGFPELQHARQQVEAAPRRFRRGRRARRRGPRARVSGTAQLRPSRQARDDGGPGQPLRDLGASRRGSGRLADITAEPETVAAAGDGGLRAVTTPRDSRATRSAGRCREPWRPSRTPRCCADEAVDALRCVADGCYVDGTFGRGGHSRAILARLGTGRTARMRSTEIRRRLRPALRSTIRASRSCTAASRDCRKCWRVSGCDRVDGVLLDLGVSSPQLDAARSAASAFGRTGRSTCGWIRPRARARRSFWPARRSAKSGR